MTSVTAAASTSPTAQAASTFITSTITTPSSTQISATSATASGSATSKSPSPWDNLNLLLIFVPLVLIFVILGVVYYGRRWFPKLREISWKLKKASRDVWNWFLAHCYGLVNVLFYGSPKTKSSKEPSVSAWARATQGVQNIAVNAKSTTTNATTSLRSISLPSWPSFPARKPKRPVITHHFDLPQSPEKDNTPPFTTLPEDPFPDTSTVASLSIVEEPELHSTPDAVYLSR